MFEQINSRFAQIVKKIKYARIVEFVSIKGYEEHVWKKILIQCELKNVSITDFFVVGKNQNKNLLNIGFKIMKKNNKYYNIPNLLSPLDYRQWSEDFHIGGTILKKNNYKNFNQIWFTKGDGDRDHPTRYDLNID